MNVFLNILYCTVKLVQMFFCKDNFAVEYGTYILETASFNRKQDFTWFWELPTFYIYSV